MVRRSSGLGFDVDDALAKTLATLKVNRNRAAINEVSTPTREGGEQEMSEDKRRSVFQVFAVDPKTAKILIDERVVARDGNEATLKAVAGKDIDLDKVDIGCTVVVEGFIRPKKETQKVTIEKEEKEGATA